MTAPLGSGGRIGTLVATNAATLRIAAVAAALTVALLLPPPISTVARIGAASGFGLLAVYELLLTVLGVRARLRNVVDANHTWIVTAAAFCLFALSAILLLP